MKKKIITKLIEFGLGFLLAGAIIFVSSHDFKQEQEFKKNYCQGIKEGRQDYRHIKDECDGK